MITGGGGSGRAVEEDGSDVVSVTLGHPCMTKKIEIYICKRKQNVALGEEEEKKKSFKPISLCFISLLNQ